MATAYGGWCGGDDYRARLDYTTSTTNTAVTIDATTKLNSGSGGYASNWPSSWNTKVGSATASGSGNLSFGASATTGTLSSKKQTINKTHSAQTITVSAYVNSYAGGSTATASVSVPALASYTVSYNMNGGSGSIGNQTKWYGETLTLSSTVPTRTNYTFKGWATSQANANAGTVSYQKGASYTGNAALTLFAVWELAVIPPVLSETTLYRTAGANATRNDDGTYAYLKVVWSVDTTKISTNKGATLTAQWRAKGGSYSTTNTTTVSLSAVSGTTTTNLKNSSGTVISNFATNTTYEVLVTVTDTAGTSSSVTLVLSQSYAPITVTNQGKSLGFGRMPLSTSGTIVFGDTLVPHFDAPDDWVTALGLNGIGTIMSATKGSLSVSAAQDTYTKGATVVLTPGTWIVRANFSFNSASGSSNSTTVSIGPESGQFGGIRQRVWQSAANWVQLQTMCTIEITSSTTTANRTISVYGASSIARSGCSSEIYAIRIR